jgi:hypothetical protein
MKSYKQIQLFFKFDPLYLMEPHDVAAPELH